MLFMAVQTHEPKDCPLNDKNPKLLYDAKNKKVKVVNIYACPPAHTFYYILESDDFKNIQDFFMDGMTRCVTDIKPVTRVE